MPADRLAKILQTASIQVWPDKRRRNQVWIGAPSPLAPGKDRRPASLRPECPVHRTGYRTGPDRKGPDPAR